MKAYVYVSLLSSVLVSSSAYAACTPAPDCASLGYTASSCPNGGVKCPWNTNLWHCDKSCEDFGFKYACTEANEIGGGEMCNGKYSYCSCSSDYVWKNGSCLRMTALQGWCCNDGNFDDYYGDINVVYHYQEYPICLRNEEYSNCSDMQAACKAFGGTPQVIGTGGAGHISGSVHFRCEF